MKKKAIKKLIILSLLSMAFLTSCSSKTFDSADTVKTANTGVDSFQIDEAAETAVATTTETDANISVAPIVQEEMTVVETISAATSGTTSPVSSADATVATTTQPIATTAATKTTKATQTTTAATVAPPVETFPSQTMVPAYEENCENIKSLIIAQLQAKGLWYPDAEVNGGGSIQLSVGYANADEQYATAFVNGKFGRTISTGVTSVSVWIEDGWLNISCTMCTLPTA